MQKIPLSNKQYFTILGSGINEFEGKKNYYSTSSIKGTEILEPEEIITYKTRPSRANMQPLEGIVCFAKMSQTLKVFKIDEDFAKSSILSTGFSLILPNKELVSSEYLKYYFLSSDFNYDKDSLSTGTTQVAINNEGIKKINIPMFSIETQHLIVSEIEKQFSRLDEGLASLKRTKENLKKYKASVLKSAVEGKLTEDFRKTQKLESASILLKQILEERKKKFLRENPGKKYKEPEAIKQDDLPNIELPEVWEFVNFPQLAEYGKNSIKAGPFGSSLKKEFYTKKGYKIYGQEQVISGNPYYGDYYIDENRYNSLISCKVKPGDILISLVGTIGKVLILPENIEEGIINPRLVKFSLDKNLVLSKYIEILLNSDLAKSFFKLFSHGGTMEILNLTILNKLPVPLPPLSEQNEIVKIVESKLSVVEKLEKIVNENIKKAENLKQSILKKAFEGELVREV